jgi:alkylation response protein AidB-like acyl-CoA dehydrogenase
MLAVNEMSFRLLRREWFGGTGTTTDYDIQHAFRMATQQAIAKGTRSAQKVVIALQLLGWEFAGWRKWEEVTK